VGRSWRNFFRRNREPEPQEATGPAVDTVQAPEAEAPGEPEASNGTAGSEAPVDDAPTVDDATIVEEPEAEERVAEESVLEEPVVGEEPAPEEFVYEEAVYEETADDPASDESVLDDEVSDEEPVQELAEPVDAEAVLAEADEEEASGGWFRRLSTGLRRSRESFVGQLNAAVAEFQDAGDEEFWERVEEILITSDVGVPTTAKLVAGLEQEALERNITSGRELRELMIEHAARMLDGPVELDISHEPTVVLMVGVNGTGKTTNIGKLVHFLPGKKMLAAGDTFRAAAIEQLQTWGERTGAEVVARERGADAAAVAHDAVDRAVSEGVDVLLIDTAGRLHTKTNLMAELDKVKRVIGRRLPGAPHEVLLTVDATTGQNGLRQAKMFGETAGVTGIILTKLDGTAKGGIALAIADEIGVPIKMISVGEQVGDLHPFEAREFAEALFGDL
jgi:fused signal recognition particle receptor